MLPNESVVLVASTLSEFIVTSEQYIIDQKANKPELIQWLVDNEDRIKERNFPILREFYTSDCGYETLRIYCEGMGQLLMEEQPNLYADWLADDNSPCDIAEWYKETVMEAINEFVGPMYQLSSTWDSLFELIEQSAKKDLSASSIDDLNALIETESGYIVSESDFASIDRSEKSINQAIAVFQTLAAKDLDTVNENCLEIKMLARWHQGEDLLYVKLEC